MKRSWLVAGILASMLVGAARSQAALSVVAPPDRLALPGAFVTLVFRVSSGTAGTAHIEVASEHGYPLLAPAGMLAVRAGVATPVPVTVEIPVHAPALTVDEVTLTATLSGQTATASTRVTVGERRGLQLQAPGQVSLSSGTVPLTVVNSGNVVETLTLQLTVSGTTVSTRSLVVKPGGRRTVHVAVHRAGSYEAVALVDGKPLARAVIRVRQTGVPAPPPLKLEADVSGSVTTTGSWGFAVRLHGPLSDYAGTRAAFFANNPEASFLSVDAPHWSATAGALSRPPLSLPLPSEIGVRASYDAAPWSVGSAASWVGGDRFSGYVFGGRHDEHQTASAAVGMHAGTPMAAASASQRFSTHSWSADAQLLDGAVSGSLTLGQNVGGPAVSASFGVTASTLFTPYGRVRFEASYSDPEATLYGRVDAPAGRDAVWAAHAGAVLDLPTVLSGRLYLSLQGGTDKSFASLGYATDLPGGWHTSTLAGVTQSRGDLGLRAASSWTYAVGPNNTLGADADVTFVPATGGTSGRIAARYAEQFGPVVTSLTGGWDLGRATVGLGAAAQWQAASWGLQGVVNAAYDTRTGSVSASVGLSGRVAADLAVPAGLVALAGGRRQGLLEGEVAAGPAGIPDVRVKVGSYVVRTDASGRFSAHLPPGPVQVSLELASVPIQYRVDGPLERNVTIADHRTSTVDFTLVASAAIRGTVLLDSNGDGKADRPAVPGSGTVLLDTGSGPPQVLPVGSDGTFQARGLYPGAATLELANLPPATSVEGAARVTVRLQPGKVSAVGFLEVPPTATAQMFSPSSFRITRVRTQVGRVPPGAAPVIRVDVQGHADRVSVDANGSEYALSAHDGTWSGRLPVPRDARAGVFRFDVVAQSGADRSRRQGQLLVEPGAPLYDVRTSSPAEAGSTLAVSIAAYTDVASVTVTSPFGGTVDASRSEPGQWTASIAIPKDAASQVGSVVVTLHTTDHGDIVATTRIRVVAP